MLKVKLSWLRRKLGGVYKSEVRWAQPPGFLLVVSFQPGCQNASGILFAVNVTSSDACNSIPDTHQAQVSCLLAPNTVAFHGALNFLCDRTLCYDAPSFPVVVLSSAWFLDS